MRIVCDSHEISIIPFFSRKLGKMSQNLSSATFVLKGLITFRVSNSLDSNQARPGSGSKISSKFSGINF